jgi:hypothetical protein
MDLKRSGTAYSKLSNFEIKKTKRSKESGLEPSDVNKCTDAAL